MFLQRDYDNNVNKPVLQYFATPSSFSLGLMVLWADIQDTKGEQRTILTAYIISASQDFV